MNQIKLLAIVVACFALCSCAQYTTCSSCRSLDGEPGWLSKNEAMWKAQEILVKKGCPDAKLVASTCAGKDCDFTFETTNSTLRLVIHVDRKSGRAKIVQQIHLTQTNSAPQPPDQTSIRMSSSATTNAETGAILTTETFTRGGQTNLVRVTKMQHGKVVFQNQRFCHNGELVAIFSLSDGVRSFSTVKNSPYWVQVDFLPSKDVRAVIIWGRDFIDGFYPTNGVYYPAPDADLEMKDLK